MVDSDYSNNISSSSFELYIVYTEYIYTSYIYEISHTYISKQYFTCLHVYVIHFHILRKHVNMNTIRLCMYVKFHIGMIMYMYAV